MRVLFATLLLLVSALCPAAAAPSSDAGGNPSIDAQWAAVQLAQAPTSPVYGEPTGIFRALFGPREPASATPHEPARRAPQTYSNRVPQIDPAFLPARVQYETGERPGTIVVDTRTRYLYLVEEGGWAQRYGVGVGREGFGWHGRVTIGRKAEWPTWTPPAAMRQRQPYLPVSMPGGPNNPLGARALYLYDGGRDTLFRIHGSNEPWTIGHAVSSGCIRMRNEDVIELYNRVGAGTRVVVL
jgi:lipoprotein-anchoring transpeptidase ErfK/SrfK